MYKIIFLAVAVVTTSFFGCGTAVADDKNTESSSLSVSEEYSEVVTNDAEILLDYPIQVSYPGTKQITITISFYPTDAVYCDVSAEEGSVVPGRLYLEDEYTITYSLPEAASFESDVISLEFYDYNGLIIEDKIFIEHDSIEDKCYLSSLNSKRIII